MFFLPRLRLFFIKIIGLVVVSNELFECSWLFRALFSFAHDWR
jgi:hypothetical protein